MNSEAVLTKSHQGYFEVLVTCSKILLVTDILLLLRYLLYCFVLLPS
jgi:hypothetical protein